MKRIVKHKAAYYERMKRTQAVRQGRKARDPLIIRNKPKRI